MAPLSVAGVDKIESAARRSADSLSFNDAVKLATHYFGPARKGSGSHLAIFKIPWQGDPRVNLQNKNGEAKPYQVKQLLKAIDRMEEES